MVLDGLEYSPVISTQGQCRLASAIHAKVKSSLMMRLSCENASGRLGEPVPLGAGHIKHFRRSCAMNAEGGFVVVAGGGVVQEIEVGPPGSPCRGRSQT